MRAKLTAVHQWDEEEVPAATTQQTWAFPTSQISEQLSQILDLAKEFDTAIYQLLLQWRAFLKVDVRQRWDLTRP